MARYCFISASGMRIAKPGYDAAVDPDDFMLFTTNRKHLMMIDSGSFGLSPGIRISFALARPLPTVPLVVAGCFAEGYVRLPVVIYPDTTGFTAYADGNPSGFDANGHGVQWTAFMRNRG